MNEGKIKMKITRGGVFCGWKQIFCKYVYQTLYLVFQLKFILKHELRFI